MTGPSSRMIHTSLLGSRRANWADQGGEGVFKSAQGQNRRHFANEDMTKRLQNLNLCDQL